MIGYVSTQYGNKSEQKVFDDVATYQAWNTEYAVDGIFFDEAPNTADLEDKYKSYAEKVNGLVSRFFFLLVLGCQEWVDR